MYCSFLTWVAFSLCFSVGLSCPITPGTTSPRAQESLQSMKTPLSSKHFVVYLSMLIWLHFYMTQAYLCDFVVSCGDVYFLVCRNGCIGHWQVEISKWQPGNISCGELNPNRFAHAWKSSVRLPVIVSVKLGQEERKREDQLQDASMNHSNFVLMCLITPLNLNCLWIIPTSF